MLALGVTLFIIGFIVFWLVSILFGALIMAIGYVIIKTAADNESKKRRKKANDLRYQSRMAMSMGDYETAARLEEEAEKFDP
ncbi:MAG TPA: hypothetical protein PK723_02870 [Candidatus Pacearchaeota archaeon]|nr:hypothetical protein [Candidatus Pacearchaeota archaeon]